MSKHLRRNKRKKQRKIIILSTVLLSFTLITAYSAFSTTLTLTAKGNIKEKEQTVEDLKKQVVTTGDGLYVDTYEENKYTYKGTQPNNYITFNNEEAGWRILSIESDNTIKIYKIENVKTTKFDSIGARTTGYCSKGEAPTKGCNAWAKTDNFINGTYEGEVEKDAEINTYLNTTYYNSLTPKAQSQIVSNNFNVGSVVWLNENLKEQITDEKKNKWQGKIGLISSSEYLRANSNQEECGNMLLNQNNTGGCRTANYLNDTKTEHDLVWTINPVNMTNNAITSIVTVFNSNHGNSGFIYSDEERQGETHPVTHLKNTTVLVGKGTKTNPYRIKE